MNSSHFCLGNKLEQILTNANIVACINNNLDYLITLIPEIQAMIGFEHKHPHHHLDVWQHTLEVLKNLNTTDLELNLAALLHDIGKPFCYQEGNIRHFHGHAETSAKITKHALKKIGYNYNFIDRILYLVAKHDTLIDPLNLDNNIEIVIKRLQLQYADAKSHHPDKVSFRLQKLDSIASKLNLLI